MEWRDRGHVRAALGTQFLVTGGETVQISTPEGSEAEVPLLDLQEFLVHVERPLVGDNPFGIAYEQLHHDVARMTRRLRWERRLAPRQFGELLATDRAQWQRAVEQLEDPTFSLAELALQRSQGLVHSDPDRSCELAWLGRLIAERLSAEMYSPQRVADLRGYAWAVYGNALRVAGELREAVGAFRRAREWLAAGSRRCVEALRALELEISIRRDTADYAGALERSAEVIGAYEARGQMEGMVRALVTRGSIYDLMGDPDSAVEVFQRAEYLAASIDDLWLRLCSRHSLIVSLARAGRTEEAAEMLQRSWGLYEQFAKPAVIARRHWAQGLIYLGRGAAGQAAEQLAEARAIFARNGYLIDTALVTLELAVALAERFKWSQVEELARETLALLDGQPVHREALAAVRLLQEAGARRRVDRALGRKLLQQVLSVADQRPVRKTAESS